MVTVVWYKGISLLQILEVRKSQHCAESWFTSTKGASFFITWGREANGYPWYLLADFKVHAGLQAPSMIHFRVHAGILALLIPFSSESSPAPPAFHSSYNPTISAIFSLLSSSPSLISLCRSSPPLLLLVLSLCLLCPHTVFISGPYPLSWASPVCWPCSA